MNAENNGNHRSKWANRFVKASLFNGMLATVLTAYLVYQGVFGVPAASRIVAGGGAGTWLTVGYFAYILMGVVATMVIALFFRYLEVDLRKSFTRMTSGLAWLALVLWNVGVIGSTWIMMYGGYAGGAAALPVSSGGLGWNSGQIHVNILGSLPPYIGIFMGMAVLAALLGIFDFAVVWFRNGKAEAPVQASATQ